MSQDTVIFADPRTAPARHHASKDRPADPTGGAAVYTTDGGPTPRTLLDVFAASVAASPDATALDDGAVRLSYRALSERVGTLACEIASEGIGVGDRVGVRMSSGGVDLYLAVLAVLAVGAAYVPTDVDDPPERAETVWREAGVCAVLQDGPALTLRPAVPVRGERRAASPGDDAWIIFTSGSTGTPKGVAVTHRSAAALVDAEATWFCRERPLGAGDRVMAGLSVAFDASCEEMWLAWRHGATLVPAPRALVRSGAELGPWLVERGITVVSTVPTLAALWPSSALTTVRLLILGGEACPPELVERLDDGVREVWNTYGPTETTVVACGTRVRRADDRIRIGLPLPGWQLAVLGDGGVPVAWGQVGELAIAGVGLGRYLDQLRDAEKYRPVPGLGWQRAYRTGDRVRADRAGLVFLGRVDDQVKIGGRRIELGEIDAVLREAPGVAAAAAAVRTTPAGIALVVGYVVPEQALDLPGQGFDIEAVRSRVASALPAAMAPAISVVSALPMKTSGKVDRDALPWPVPGQPDPAAARGSVAGSDAQVGTHDWLAARWRQVLGPMPLDEHSDFFAVGGSSLAAAQLASTLRVHYPTLSVADLYQNPRLSDQARRLSQARTGIAADRTIRPTPRPAAAVQLGALLTLLGYQGLRWLLMLLAVENLLPRSEWSVRTSWWLLALGWAVLMSAPGRMVTAVAGARLLLHRIAPGTYPRGGRVHLRLWAAERLAAASGVTALAGTPWAVRFARALGCRVGRGVVLHTLPPLTGMADLGDGCSIESEADLAGWWLDGDQLHIGPVAVGAGSRIGARSTLMPGATVGRHAEVAPGSCITAPVPSGRAWSGSPAVDVGPAGRRWPAPRPRRSRWNIAYSLALLGLGVLPLLSSVPALVLYWRLLPGHTSTVGSALAQLLLGAPLAVIAGWLAYLLLTAAVVRAAGIALHPGLHPDDGLVAWCTWLTERLVAGARVAFFPIYASLATPALLRLLGARVDRRVEASTALFIPRLTRLGRGAFLADDALVGHPEHHAGWLRLGPASVGDRAFIGNSAIVGPEHDVPAGALIGVLSSSPAAVPPGSTWLGRPALPLPRVAAAGDPSRTFEPPRRLVAARAMIEILRLTPMLISLVLAQSVTMLLAVLVWKAGLLLAVLAAPGILLLAGILACLCASLAKWVLVGRVRAGEHPLWSSFVWRNELADTFVEQLAVPWLAGLALGSPVFNAWQRTMGARIGRGVWCDSHWLPEPDLIELGDGASVNRGCIVQTHLFHDRIMRLDRIRMQAGVTLGPHSIVLPGSTLGRASSVGGASLVMRGETVPGYTRWFGNPIKAVLHDA